MTTLNDYLAIGSLSKLNDISKTTSEKSIANRLGLLRHVLGLDSWFLDGSQDKHSGENDGDTPEDQTDGKVQGSSRYP